MKSDTTRRTFLRRTAATGVAATGLGAASTSVTAQSTVDSWLSNTSNYDGIVDKTGQEEVTVEVGAKGNGGNFAFSPAAIRVSPGTTVTWKWVNGTHDVAAKDGSFNSKLSGEKGFTFTQTFDSTGTTLYYCTPHKSMGMKGAIVVGEGGSGGQQSEATSVDYGGWFTDEAKGGATKNYDGTTIDKTGQGSVTVKVGAQGNGGSFAFAPPAVRVSPGTTVTFEWVSDTHNVLVEDQPQGASWQGHEPLENTGFSFSHTFETKGIYKYYCQPHLSLGMKGAIVVGEGEVSAETPTGGGKSSGGGIEFDLGLLGLAIGGASVLLAPIGLAIALGREEEDGAHQRAN